MEEAGALRIADVSEASSVYQARQVFVAMVEADREHFSVQVCEKCGRSSLQHIRLLLGTNQRTMPTPEE